MSEARPDFVTITVRVPNAAHRQLKAVARRELSSVNREINVAIRAHLDENKRGNRGH